MPIGTSYQPTAPMPGTQARPQLSPQEAVKMLSLRLPKSPQNLPVPAQLLNAQGGGGAGNLTALLQALMRAARGGTPGTREEVPGAPVTAIDNGLSDQTRGYSWTPHITIAGDPGGQVAGDPGPMQDTPLFDEGIPRIRNGAVGTRPLF